MTLIYDSFLLWMLCDRKVMKDIILTAEIRNAAKRCIWFEQPEQAVQNAPRLVAYILTHGTFEDTEALTAQLSLEELKQALDEAPAGIYDARSWAYWNLVVGRYDPPSLPVRCYKKD